MALQFAWPCCTFSLLNQPLLMSFKLERKPNYIHLRWGSDTFGPEGTKEFKTLVAKHPEDHMLVNLLAAEEFDGIEDLQDLQAERMDEMFSCILIVRESLMHLFDEDLAVVPSVLEAEDYFGMEDMQRQLLDGDN